VSVARATINWLIYVLWSISLSAWSRPRLPPTSPSNVIPFTPATRPTTESDLPNRTVMMEPKDWLVFSIHLVFILGYTRQRPYVRPDRTTRGRADAVRSGNQTDDWRRLTQLNGYDGSKRLTGFFYSPDGDNWTDGSGVIWPACPRPACPWPACVCLTRMSLKRMALNRMALLPVQEHRTLTRMALMPVQEHRIFNPAWPW